MKTRTTFFSLLLISVILGSGASAQTLSLTSGIMPILTGASAFTFSGNLTLSGTLDVRVGAVNALLVGGGGGGSTGTSGSRWGSGGGGGQVISISGGMLSLSSYNITVGGGGLGGAGGGNNPGANGGTSSFGALWSAIGGKGAPITGVGGASGSGRTGGTFGTQSAGGGGGDSANGFAGSGSTGGAGGAGTSSSITGSSVVYGGGGGGTGQTTRGAGGSGGGGAGGDYDSNLFGVNGTANTGGGGGGGWANAAKRTGDGGSGVVIVSYYGLSTAATGGNLGTINANNANYYRRFTATGTLGLTDPASQVAIFSGDISGSFGLTKNAAGTLILNGNNAYTGATTINGGKLLVNGSLTNASAVTVVGGTLGGTGTVGNVTVQNGAVLAPGNSTGVFNTGNLNLASNSVLAVEINSATDFDQIFATGTVSLTNAVLSLFLGYTPAPGTQFTIIDNDDTDAVLGEFGSILNGTLFTVSYTGGTGNDVVLTYAIPEPSTWALVAVALVPLFMRRRYGVRQSSAALQFSSKQGSIQ